MIMIIKEVMMYTVKVNWNVLIQDSGIDLAPYVPLTLEHVMMNVVYKHLAVISRDARLEVH